MNNAALHLFHRVRVKAPFLGIRGGASMHVSPTWGTKVSDNHGKITPMRKMGGAPTPMRKHWTRTPSHEPPSLAFFPTARARLSNLELTFSLAREVASTLMENRTRSFSDRN